MSDIPERTTFDVTLRITALPEFGRPEDWEWAVVLGLTDAESVAVLTVRDVSMSLSEGHGDE